jgi:hypothetical protein
MTASLFVGIKSALAVLETVNEGGKTLEEIAHKIPSVSKKRRRPKDSHTVASEWLSLLESVGLVSCRKINHEGRVLQVWELTIPREEPVEILGRRKPEKATFRNYFTAWFLALIAMRPRTFAELNEKVNIGAPTASKYIDILASKFLIKLASAEELKGYGITPSSAPYFISQFFTYSKRRIDARKQIREIMNRRIRVKDPEEYLRGKALPDSPVQVAVTMLRGLTLWTSLLLLLGNCCRR